MAIMGYSGMLLCSLALHMWWDSDGGVSCSAFNCSCVLLAG